jgi:hypothetical protein
MDRRILPHRRFGDQLFEIFRRQYAGFALLIMSGPVAEFHYALGKTEQLQLATICLKDTLKVVNNTLYTLGHVLVPRWDLRILSNKNCGDDNTPN